MSQVGVSGPSRLSARCCPDLVGIVACCVVAVGNESGPSPTSRRHGDHRDERAPSPRRPHARERPTVTANAIAQVASRKRSHLRISPTQTRKRSIAQATQTRALIARRRPPGSDRRSETATQEAVFAAQTQTRWTSPTATRLRQFDAPRPRSRRLRPPKPRPDRPPKPPTRRNRTAAASRTVRGQVIARKATFSRRVTLRLYRDDGDGISPG